MSAVKFFSSQESISSFQPSTYGTVWAWWKYNTGISLNSGNISQWSDNSGNGRHLTQSTANRQPLGTYGTAIFDGSNDQLATGSYSCPGTYTLFMLMRVNTPGYVCSFNAPATNMLIGSGYLLNYDFFTFHGVGASNPITSSTVNAIPCATYVVLALKYVAGDNVPTLYKNGIKLPTTSTGSSTSAGGTGTFSVGSNCKVEMMESIIYSSNVSDTNIATISNYLLAVKTYSKVGTIYTSQFTSSSEFSNNWATSQALNFTPSANGLVVTPTAANGKALLYYKTDLEDWEFTGQIIVGTIGATTNGIGLGIYSTFSGLDFQSYISLRTGDLGRVYHVNSQGAFNNSGSYVLGSISTSSVIYYKIIREKDLYTSIYWTSPTNLIIFSKAMTYTNFGVTAGVSAISQPVIQSLSATGSHTLQNYYFKSVARKTPQWLFKGDSITAGLFAQYAGTRWTNDTIQDISTFTVLGGPQEKTADMIGNINEIIAINPQKCFLLAGINDMYASVPQGTIVANMTTIVTALEAAGITVIICKLLPCNAFNVTTLNAAYVTAFGTRVKVDFYTSMVGNGTNINATYSSDGLHPNVAGCAQMATILLNSGAL